jgi:hypothetical protein
MAIVRAGTSLPSCFSLSMAKSRRQVQDLKMFMSSKSCEWQRRDQEDFLEAQSAAFDSRGPYGYDSSLFLDHSGDVLENHTRVLQESLPCVNATKTVTIFRRPLQQTPYSSTFLPTTPLLLLQNPNLYQDSSRLHYGFHH